MLAEGCFIWLMLYLPLLDIFDFTFQFLVAVVATPPMANANVPALVALLPVSIYTRNKHSLRLNIYQNDQKKDSKFFQHSFSDMKHASKIWTTIIQQQKSWPRWPSGLFNRFPLTFRVENMISDAKILSNQLVRLFFLL